MFIRIFFLFSFLFSTSVVAWSNDSLRSSTSLDFGLTVGNIINMDQYQRLWLQQSGMQSMQIGGRWHTERQPDDVFAQAYNFPEWAITLSMGNFSEVKMQKTPNPLWGNLQVVDYRSDMGYLFGLYGQFSRPLWRKHRWTLGYALEEGFSFNTRPYNAEDNADNELTGSPLLIHFGASVWCSFRLSSQWTLRTDWAFRHVSNGATDRPNKGANWLAPTVSLQYTLPQNEQRDAVVLHILHQSRSSASQQQKYWYGQVSVGLGVKTLLEEWLHTQYEVGSAAENYRTADFTRYLIYAVQPALMYRYSTKWAVGIGADAFYLSYINRVKAFNQDNAERLSPLSLGLSLQHEAFYHRWAMNVQLGYYLLRQTGLKQKNGETNYYERVALRYHFPLSTTRRRPSSFFLGLGIKAHATKADFTELSLGYTF